MHNMHELYQLKGLDYVGVMHPIGYDHHVYCPKVLIPWEYIVTKRLRLGYLYTLLCITLYIHTLLMVPTMCNNHCINHCIVLERPVCDSKTF